MVGNEESTSELGAIGVRGIAGFDQRKEYLIVRAPTLDASSPTGFRIPKNMNAAVDELRLTLPQDYLKSLHWVRSSEGSYCASSSEKLDHLVIGWLKTNWKLRNSDNPLVLQSGIEPHGELFPDLVANAVIKRLCPASQ